MRNSFTVVLCCITLLVVIFDLFVAHVTPVRAQGSRTIYVDTMGNNNATIKTRGATVVGFSCTDVGGTTCYAASE